MPNVGGLDIVEAKETEDELPDHFLTWDSIEYPVRFNGELLAVPSRLKDCEKSEPEFITRLVTYTAAI